MKSVALKAHPRSQVQRAEVKKLRASGRVPATIYGRQAKPQNLEVNSKEFTDLLNHSVSENLLVDLSVENDARSKRLALVQEIQHHPLDGKVLHVDFHEVAENEKVTVQVPVETTGEPVGVKTGGGTLEHILFKVKVRCLPKDLPEQIVLDVTALEIGAEPPGPRDLQHEVSEAVAILLDQLARKNRQRRGAAAKARMQQPCKFGGESARPPRTGGQ